MHLSAFLIDAVKGSVCHRVLSGGVVTVVGELLARGDPRSFTNDAITFDHKQASVLMPYDPFAP